MASLNLSITLQPWFQLSLQIGHQPPQRKHALSPAAETVGPKSKRRRTRTDTSDISTSRYESSEPSLTITNRSMSPDDQHDSLDLETEDSITDCSMLPDDQSDSGDLESKEAITDCSTLVPDDQSDSGDLETEEAMTDCSVLPDDQSDSEDLGTEEAITEPVDETIASGQNPAFLNLPIEIRMMIYRQLLVSSTSIDNLREIMGISNSMLPRDQDFDSAILRVCRQTYFEGHPILYGQNVFLFERGCEVMGFRGFMYGLSRGNIPLGYEDGRLTFLESIIIRLRRKDSLNYSQTTPIEEVRASAWSLLGWNAIFDTEGSRDSYSFPGLRSLTIDFTEWHLDDADEIAVKTFVRKFSKCNYLRRLTIRGMSHQRNLDDLRHGILRNGGIFIVLDRSGTEVAKLDLSI
ncbi:MAG: hypothetical protein LQ342_006702 [Letrouitia transgressa]|nr:MAG: hypothetical protein LQ342_006702 [Letrouitia transgressa]